MDARGRCHVFTGMSGLKPKAMKPSRRFPFQNTISSILPVFAACGLTGHLSAQTTWIGNASNDLNSAGNWSAGAPSSSLNSIFTTAGTSGTSLSLTADLQFGGGTAPTSNAMLFDGAGFTIGGNNSSRMLTIGGQGLAINTTNTVTLDVARVRRNASNTFEFLGSSGNLVVNSDFSTNITGASDTSTRVDFTGTGGNNNTITFNGAIVNVFTGTAGTGFGNMTISSVGTGNKVVFNNTSNSGFTGSIAVGNNALLHLGNGGTKGTLAGSTSITLGNSVSTFAINQTDAVVQGTDFAPSITGSGKVEQIGSGTTTLNAANGYAGGTNVTGGTLLVNNTTGSATGTGAVNVSTGAALGGAGIISGAVTISGALKPGNSIGTITVGNDVTWNGGNAWVFELGTPSINLAAANIGGTRDLLDITGAGSDFLKGTGSSWTFNFAGTGAAGWYKLVDWAGTTTFSQGDFSVTNLTTGLTGSFVVDSGTSALYLNVVPEPGAALLGGIGMIFLLRRRR